MIKETLTYKDYNGEERTEDRYFHMTKIEWLRFDKKYGGMKEYIAKAIRDNDEYGILNLLEDLVRTAYGEKSSDGVRFVKSQELLDRFMQTEAYSDMIIGFLTDTEKGIAFFNRLAPADLNEGDQVKQDS